MMQESGVGFLILDTSSWIKIPKSWEIIIKVA